MLGSSFRTRIKRHILIKKVIGMEMKVKNTIPKYSSKEERALLIQRAYVNLQKQLKTRRVKSGEK